MQDGHLSRFSSCWPRARSKALCLCLMPGPLHLSAADIQMILSYGGLSCRMLPGTLFSPRCHRPSGYDKNISRQHQMSPGATPPWWRTAGLRNVRGHSDPSPALPGKGQRCFGILGLMSTDRHQLPLLCLSEAHGAALLCRELHSCLTPQRPLCPMSGKLGCLHPEASQTPAEPIV